MSNGRSGWRSGGRADRRALPPAVNPCTPGRRIRPYLPLSQSGMTAISAAARRPTADLGVGEVAEIMVKPSLAAGATFGGGRVLLVQALVARVIGMAAKTLTVHGNVSPRRYGVDAVTVTQACTGHGLPSSSISAAQSGVTSGRRMAIRRVKAARSGR